MIALELTTLLGFFCGEVEHTIVNLRDPEEVLENSSTKTYINANFIDVLLILDRAG